ncbi:MAG: toprim domain-containing protein [Achromobacter sp.]|uniref:DNA primase n=1 Tax=Achromobacter sp. TaxID=134375 RepID=UPI0012D0B1E2|nr:CHC2 zinc finger domain-containing protein [Achromobacter sp.]MPS81754.1 toprim domain-containing protein [Achromobacter sp.]
MAIIRNEGGARAPRIPDDVVDQVKLRADENIVDVIGEAVSLRKAGSSYVGLCPFHTEKSPSFNVVPAKGFFFCHGCGAKGRAVEFQQQYFGMPFPDVIREFAGRFGIRIPADGSASPVPPQSPTGPRRPPAPVDQDVRPTVSSERRDSLSAVLGEALEFFRGPANHDRPMSASLRTWAERRCLTDESLARFEIGITSRGWQGLREAFGSRYDTDQRLLDADLVRETDDKTRRYDTFRDRVMFPVRDVDGTLVGFGGRRLQDDEKDERTPKYLNTGTTDIFHKGHLLYGLNLATQSIEDRGYALVVEGYMDVVVLAQWGFPNTVASLGTAFRGSHLNLLRGYTSEVVYLFDGDAAGERAMWRAVKESLPYADRVNFRFITLDGQDPDEWVRSVGPDAVHDAIVHAETLAPYFLRRVREMLAQDGAQATESTAQDTGQQRPGSFGHQDRTQEFKGLVSLIPQRSHLRQFLDREVNRILAPAPESKLTNAVEQSQLAELPAEKRLAIAAMLQPNLALQVRPALLALLPNGHPACGRIIDLYDRGIEQGRTNGQPARPPADLAWARVTLTHTPELLTELLAPTESPHQVDQTRTRDRSAPSQ